MNLKLRFALLFTLLVAVIISFSMAMVYLLYSNYRQEDFYKRLETQAIQTYQLFFATYPHDTVITKRSLELPVQRLQLYNEEDYLVSGVGNKVFFNYPDTAVFFLSREIMSKARQKLIERFDIGEKEGVIHYFPEKNVYSVSYAWDKVGRRKLTNLSYILFFVCLGSVILTAFVSFIYARQITRPLARLNDEFRNISETNLTRRVNVGKGNDELNQLARSFNEMLNRLEKAFNIQKSFVHHASHELRTPLASMVSQTEVALREQRSPAYYQAVLESLKEDQQGLIDLTNSLLSLSQFEKIQSTGSWPEIRLDELLFDMVEASRKLFKDIRVSINFTEVPESYEALTIRGNETLLKSAFINLIKNGYRYSDNKKVDITLKTGTNNIYIIVENTGRLIDEEERSRLFIPFFRGQNAMGLKGYGLGLSIVNRIVHLHVGTVHYEAVGDNVNRFVVEFIK